jgi:uncharacterized Zn finger protein
MRKNMKCINCGNQFATNIENVNSEGKVLDVQCSWCGSFEVNIFQDSIEVLPLLEKPKSVVRKSLKLPTKK